MAEEARARELWAEAEALGVVVESMKRLNTTLLASLRDLEATADNLERFADMNRAWAVVFEGDPPLDHLPQDLSHHPGP